MLHNIDYSSIIKKSWKITWENKWLWVYGLIIAALGGSSSQSGGGSGGSSGSTSSKVPDLKKIPDKLPEDTQKVLGAATSAVSEWFGRIPIGTWIIIGSIILLLMIISLIVAAIARSWATAGLIGALSEISNGQQVSLKSTSVYGLKSWKKLFEYWLTTGFFTFGIILLAFLLFIPAIMLLSSIPVAGIILLIFAIFISLILIMTAIIAVSVTSIYAERLMVIQELTPWQAWTQGFKLARKYFWSALVMGIVNGFAGCAGGCLSLLVIAFFILIPLMLLLFGGLTAFSGFQNGMPFLSYLALPVIINSGLKYLIAFIWFNSLTGAIIIVWSYSNWNEYFREIIKIENNQL
jgi:hypothetical protein